MNLSRIMRKQKQLMAAMDWPAGAPLPEGNEGAAKSHLLAAIHECAEAMNELNWKPWKANKKVIDRDAFTTELMDIVQFVANAALVMDISAEELAGALELKWEENFARIKRGEVTSGVQPGQN